MEQLITCLKQLRLKLERFEKDTLKETPTRTIILRKTLDNDQ
jgi:hypothetical protein